MRCAGVELTVHLGWVRMACAPQLRAEEQQMELVEVAENEWVFRDPALTHEIESRFNDALDA